MAAGPEGIHEVVKRLVREGTPAAMLGEAAAQLQPGGPPLAPLATTDLHNLAPVGARGSHSTALRCSGDSFLPFSGTSNLAGLPACSQLFMLR